MQDQDYYVFYVNGQSANDYLGGTNYVGIWSESRSAAKKLASKYFNESLIMASRAPEGEKIGYLY